MKEFKIGQQVRILSLNELRSIGHPTSNDDLSCDIHAPGDIDGDSLPFFLTETMIKLCGKEIDIHNICDDDGTVRCENFTIHPWMCEEIAVIPPDNIEEDESFNWDEMILNGVKSK